MRRTNQPAVRAAILLYEQFVERNPPSGPVLLPVYAWNDIRQLCQKIGKARQRGWQLAARRLNRDLATVVSDCRGQLATTLRSLEASNREPSRHLSASDIYHDLAALGHEFEDVEIDLQGHEIAVTTDSIVLEDVRLGRFQIRLDWRLIGHVGQPYRLVALEPHPAAKNQDVTHPHVKDKRLCAGDGHAAIAAALAAGRFYDFFLLVSQVLHTYGRDNAYVELRHWHSVSCDMCGQDVGQDEFSRCQRCGEGLCDECTFTCEGCQESYCSNCMSQCAVCGRELCRRCLETCRECQTRICGRCQQDGLCRACREKQPKEYEHDSTEDLQAAPHSAPA